MLVREVSGLPIMRSLPEGLRHEVEAQFHLRRFCAGEAIFHQGDPGTAVYFIQSGRVKVTRAASNGMEQIIGVFGAGEPFGLVVLLDDSPYPASSTALCDSMIWTIRCSELKSFLTAHPEVMPPFLKEVGERLRGAQDRVHDLSTGSVHERLAKYLLQLMKEEGRPEVWLPLTRSELGAYLGATRETISRGLTDFRRSGGVEFLKDGRLKLVPAKLEEWM